MPSQPFDLLWRSPAGAEVFIGVAPASQDAAGRRYPLLAAWCSRGARPPGMAPSCCWGPNCSAPGCAACSARPGDAAGLPELRDYLAEQESEKGMDLLEPALLEEIYNNFIKRSRRAGTGRPAGEASPATALRRTVLHLLFTRGQGPEGREEEKKYLVLPLSPEPGRSMLHASVWMDLLASWRTPPPSAPGARMPCSTRWMAPLPVHAPGPSLRPGRAGNAWAAGGCNGITTICSRGPARCTSTPCIPRFPPSWTDFSPVRPIRLWTLRDILVKLSVSLLLSSS